MILYLIFAKDEQNVKDYLIFVFINSKYKQGTAENNCRQNHGIIEEETLYLSLIHILHCLQRLATHVLKVVFHALS